jgi:hypothetical protein
VLTTRSPGATFETRAHLLDFAGDFVPEDDRHLRRWELAVANGQVELVHGASSDTNERIVGTK